MEKFKSESDKRLIVSATLNGRNAYFLIDTGASVGIIDKGSVKEYGLSAGKAFPGTLVGAGGEMKGVRYCNTPAMLKGKQVPQFVLADISSVISSIRKETGIRITGIISLPQMKMVGMQIDANDNEIIIE